jgi:hypothetical protein
MRPACGLIWLPTPASTSSFPTGKAVFLRSPSPAPLRKRVHPLVSFTPLQSAAVPCRPRASRRGAPSVGFAFPLRDIDPGHPCDGVPRPPPFRPRRFSRPRRFPPPQALWVCFTPQPRPGFALQGFVPRTQPRFLVETACPLVVGDVPLQTIARLRHRAPPRPQGFDPCPNPLPCRRVLNVDAARSPLELVLLQVFPLVAVGAPSRPLRSWP